MKSDEIKDAAVITLISKAMADIDAGLATMYDVPFNDVAVHPKGIPEKIRWITAEKAVCIAHFKLYDSGEKIETNYGRNCHDRIETQLSNLRKCLSGLTYSDGSPVPRIGDCPDDSPGPGASVITIKSNTQNDPYIFDLNDVRDIEDMPDLGWDD